MKVTLIFESCLNNCGQASAHLEHSPIWRARRPAPKTWWTKGAYTSRLMQALCKLCHITQSFSTSYHHESAGRAKQFISTILKTFRLYCSASNNWSSKLDAVLLSYRALKSTITHLSPFEVLFCTQMRLPIDTSVLSEIDTTPDVDTYVRKVVQKVELTREIAKASHNDANERSKFFCDRHAAYPQYQVGQNVLLYDETTKPGENRKTKRRYTGPWFIESTLPDYNFQLHNCKTGILMKNPEHNNRLRPFKDDRTRFHTYPGNLLVSQTRLSPQWQHLICMLLVKMYGMKSSNCLVRNESPVKCTIMYIGKMPTVQNPGSRQITSHTLPLMLLKMHEKHAQERGVRTRRRARFSTRSVCSVDSK